MHSTVIFRIKKIYDIMLSMTTAGKCSVILTERLKMHFGESEFTCSHIATENEEAYQYNVYKVTCPDSNWLVNMKLAPTESESKLLKHVTITYKDTP